VVRIDAAVMMTKPLIVASRAVSGCLRFPGWPGLPGCDPLHRPGYRALLPAALRASRAEANSTWPMAHRGGWRLIATTNAQKLRENHGVVKLSAFSCYAFSVSARFPSEDVTIWASTCRSR
jgi:hypothetical protein